MTFSRGRFVCTVLAAVFAFTTESGFAFSSNSITLPAGAELVVELTKSIDAKKARVGDEVSARLIQDLIANGQVIGPRGSRIQGHVTEVKAYSKEESESVLGLVFDKLVLSHGVEIPLHAVVQAMASPIKESSDEESSPYDGQITGGPPTNGMHAPPFSDPRVLRDHSRDDALKKAGEPGSYGKPRNAHPGGWLSAGAHGVFGISGILLKPPLVVSTKGNVKLESRTQMVLVESPKSQEKAHH